MLLSLEHRRRCDEPGKGHGKYRATCIEACSSVPRPGVFHHRRGTYISRPNLALTATESEPESSPIGGYRRLSRRFQALVPEK